MQNFIGYLRSTTAQGASGLGLADQRKAIEVYARRSGRLVEAFEDVASELIRNGQAMRKVSVLGRQTREADGRAEALRWVLEPMHGQALRSIARLNERRVPTLSGGGRWHDNTVARLLNRLEANA